MTHSEQTQGADKPDDTSPTAGSSQIDARCPECGGAGVVSPEIRGMGIPWPCGYCKGTGRAEHKATDPEASTDLREYAHPSPDLESLEVLMKAIYDRGHLDGRWSTKDDVRSTFKDAVEIWEAGFTAWADKRSYEAIWAAKVEMLEWAVDHWLDPRRVDEKYEELKAEQAKARYDGGKS